GILRWLNEGGVRDRIVDKTGERVVKLALQKLEEVHVDFRLLDFVVRATACAQAVAAPDHCLSTSSGTKTRCRLAGAGVNLQSPPTAAPRRHAARRPTNLPARSNRACRGRKCGPPRRRSPARPSGWLRSPRC